jgi:hypothetical protein
MKSRFSQIQKKNTDVGAAKCAHSLHTLTHAHRVVLREHLCTEGETCKRFAQP